MKKILFGLLGILSIFLVSCSDTGKNVENQLASIFTQEEVDFANDTFNHMHPKYNILKKTINTQKITIAFESDKTDDKGVVIKDDKGNVIRVKIVLNFKKSNGAYIEYFSTLENNKPDGSGFSLDLTLQRLLGKYNESDYFTQSQYDGFAKYLLDNSNFFEGILLNGCESTNLVEINGVLIKSITHLNIFVVKFLFGDKYQILYNASIVISNGRYVAIDESGLIATENTLEALLANKSLRDKIDYIILANADTAKNISKSTSITSKKSTYDFHNIFKK